MRENGYRTALIGKWHLGHGEPGFSANKHGFDYQYGSEGGCVDYFTMKYGYKPDWARNGKQIVEEGYSTDLITDDAVRYLKGKHEKPFFLFLSYTAPHYGKGWDEEEKKFTNILQSKPEDRARFPHITDTNRLEYAGMVAAMDDGVGRVMETLKKQKLDKNTLVIFTSDNGGDYRYGGSNKPFRGQKAQLFEGGIRLPCLMRWPGKIKAGSVTDQPISGLDFFPTFCSLAGISEFTFTGRNGYFAGDFSGKETVARPVLAIAQFRRVPSRPVEIRARRQGRNAFQFGQRSLRGKKSCERKAGVIAGIESGALESCGWNKSEIRKPSKINNAQTGFVYLSLTDRHLMGNTYTNYTLCGPSQQEIAKALAGRSAIVTPPAHGCVVVFDEQSDELLQAAYCPCAPMVNDVCLPGLGSHEL